ncbi:gp099 [Rhodococcus phage ReqiPoco6]|uniref:Gp099 n=1 Tax=Rhodococcus phage ReqiPoco6 TaxID=691964 RepID=D4P7W7_9CAUD|nr:gp099 [Rhodococcus phage ReqiPoco6]ADD81097.1 gp099 [Rhodococcus phage ReqiPoco6]
MDSMNFVSAELGRTLDHVRATLLHELHGAAGTDKPWADEPATVILEKYISFRNAEKEVLDDKIEKLTDEKVGTLKSSNLLRDDVNEALLEMLDILGVDLNDVENSVRGKLSAVLEKLRQEKSTETKVDATLDHLLDILGISSGVVSVDAAVSTKSRAIVKAIDKMKENASHPGVPFVDVHQYLNSFLDILKLDGAISSDLPGKADAVRAGIAELKTELSEASNKDFRTFSHITHSQLNDILDVLEIKVTPSSVEGKAEAIREAIEALQSDKVVDDNVDAVDREVDEELAHYASNLYIHAFGSAGEDTDLTPIEKLSSIYKALAERVLTFSEPATLNSVRNDLNVIINYEGEVILLNEDLAVLANRAKDLVIRESNEEKSEGEVTPVPSNTDDIREVMDLTNGMLNNFLALAGVEFDSTLAIEDKGVMLMNAIKAMRANEAAMREELFELNRITALDDLHEYFDDLIQALQIEGDIYPSIEKKKEAITKRIFDQLSALNAHKSYVDDLIVLIYGQENDISEQFTTGEKLHVLKSAFRDGSKKAISADDIRKVSNSLVAILKRAGGDISDSRGNLVEVAEYTERFVHNALDVRDSGVLEDSGDRKNVFPIEVMRTIHNNLEEIIRIHGEDTHPDETTAHIAERALTLVKDFADSDMVDIRRYVTRIIEKCGGEVDPEESTPNLVQSADILVHRSKRISNNDWDSIRNSVSGIIRTVGKKANPDEPLVDLADRAQRYVFEKLINE